MDPDINHAAAALRRIKDDPRAAQDVAERGRQALHRFMDPRAWSAHLYEALGRHHPASARC
jgi:hypothetical protein